MFFKRKFSIGDRVKVIKGARTRWYMTYSWKMEIECSDLYLNQRQYPSRQRAFEHGLVGTIIGPSGDSFFDWSVQFDGYRPNNRDDYGVWTSSEILSYMLGHLYTEDDVIYKYTTQQDTKILSINKYEYHDLDLRGLVMKILPLDAAAVEYSGDKSLIQGKDWALREIGVGPDAAKI